MAKLGSQGDIELIELQQIIDRLCKAITIRYNAEIANSFKADVEAESYDLETLTEELEAEDVDDCTFVDTLSDSFPDTFPDDNSKSELLNILKNAFQGTMPKRPSNVVTMDPKKMKWSLTKKQVEPTKEYLNNTLKSFIVTNDQNDRSLIDVVAIGKKNDIPLLTWLTDTLNRYAIQKHFEQKKFDHMDWSSHYALFKDLRKQNKLTIVQKLDSAVKSFHKRMFPFPHLKYAPIAYIDDDVNAFVRYFLAMNQAIDTVVESQPSCPFQIDLWIIPRNVESAVMGCDEKEDDDEDEDEDDDEVGIDVIGNIDHRLKSAKWNFNKVEMERGNDLDARLKRTIAEGLNAILDRERDKRLVVLIDRRNPKHVATEDKCEAYIENMLKHDSDHLKESVKLKKARRGDTPDTWNDTIYFAQAPEEKYNKIPKNALPLNQFWASTQSMLPRLKCESTDDSGGFGCKRDFNCFQFTVSWHVTSEDVVKMYWFMQNWGTRLFPNDAHRLWPNYFSKTKLGTKQNVDKSLVKSLEQRPQVVDPGFENWYELSTKTKLT